MDFYKKYLNELKLSGIPCDKISDFLKIKKVTDFEDEFKNIFPNKVIDLIIHNNLHLAPKLINSGSKLLSFTAKFCLSNPR